VQPEAIDIAAPEFPPRVQWVGEEPPAMGAMTAIGPVLVHFFDFAQLNSMRTVPYLCNWHERYAGLGLSVLGVNSPRFPFTADADAVAAARERFGITYPVAVDGDFNLWLDYGCEGWPSLFLWGQGGALRWFHFGEGEYGATERAIQAALLEVDASLRLPDPMAPLRATDAEGAGVLPPTEEIFPGGSAAEPWVFSDGDDPLRTEYAAGGVYVTVAGEGDIVVELDGHPLPPTTITTPGLYQLASHEHHESHLLTVRPTPGQSIYAISFSAGIP
jgi:hypothetical protein